MTQKLIHQQKPSQTQHQYNVLMTASENIYHTRRVGMAEQNSHVAESAACRKEKVSFSIKLEPRK